MLETEQQVHHWLLKHVPVSADDWATLKEEYLSDILGAIDGALQDEELDAMLARAKEMHRSRSDRAGERKGSRRRDRSTMYFIPEDQHARITAEEEWLGKQAALAQPVKHLRALLLPEGQLLTPEQVDAFFASPAPRFIPWRLFRRYRIPLINHVSRYAGDDGYWELSLRSARQLAFHVEPPNEVVHVKRRDDLEDQVEHIFLPTSSRTIRECLIWPGSMFDDLRKLDGWFVRHFPCQEGMGLWFLLTGDLKIKPPLAASWQATRVRHAGGSHTSARIYLEVDARLSSEDVRQAYLRAQVHVLGHEARSIRADSKTFNVFRFAVAHMSDDGQLPPWPDLVRQWNEEHPKQRYEAVNRLHEDLAAQMKRDYGNACKSILEPDLLVPDEKIEKLDGRTW